MKYSFLTFLSLVLFAAVSSGQTLSFGPLGLPQVIPGTNNVTYTTTTVQGGTATPQTHNQSGSVTSSLGGTFDGTFFDPAVDPDTSLTTLIGSTVRENIDEGISGDYANFVGLNVSFSEPVPLFSFGFVDLDGNQLVGQNEWVGSFGTNSGATVIPGITLGDPTAQAQRPSSTVVDWSGLVGAPTTYAVAFNNDASAGVDPDDPTSQVAFDYGGALVDNLYFVWGLEGDETGNPNQDNNSGVTGFRVFTEVESVPEPSSAALFALGGLFFAGRRRRS